MTVRNTDSTAPEFAAQAPPRRLLLVLFFGVLIAALDIAIVGPALSSIQEHFAVDARQIAWVFNTFVLTNLVGVPLMAKLADLYGRRRIYCFDLALFAVGSITVATAPTFAALILGRAIQGFGAAGIFPIASAVVGDVYSPSRRGRALGVLGSVFGIAFIIGPALSGIILQYSWRWLFYLTVPLAVGVLLAALITLPSGSRRVSSKPFDALGLLIIGLALGSISIGLTGVDTSAFAGSIFSIRVAPYLLAFLVLMPAFVAVERRAQDPIIRVSLFDAKQVRIAIAVTVGAGFAEAVIIFVPSLAVATFDVPGTTASFMFLPLAAAVAVGAPVVGRMVDRVGSRAVIASCAFALTIGLALLGWTDASETRFYAGSILVGIALSGLLGSALNYIMLAEAGEDERASAQGMVTLAVNAGLLMGGAVIGAVTESASGQGEGLANAFRLVAIAAAVLLALSAGLKTRALERAPS